MTKPASDVRRYRIIIRGECRRLLLSLVDNIQAEASRNGDTCVVALVRDDREFWGLMQQLQDLALHIVSLQDLGHGKRPDNRARPGPVTMLMPRHGDVQPV
jgi:hypothetical protein